MAQVESREVGTVVTAERIAEAQAKRDMAVHLLEGWLADESGYDETVWPELKAALEQDRLSSRKRFDE